MTIIYIKQKKDDGIVTLEFNERSSSLKTASGKNMNAQTPYNNCLHVFIGNVKEISNTQIENFNTENNKINDIQIELKQIKCGINKI